MVLCFGWLLVNSVDFHFSFFVCLGGMVLIYLYDGLLI